MKKNWSRRLRRSTIRSKALNLLRRWKRREMLRIGTRDLLRHETVRTAATQLSDVAAVAIDFALAIVMQQRLDADGLAQSPGTFAVIATGALGGREMSYEPDVDLLYVYDAQAANGVEAPPSRDFFVRVGCGLTAALRDETHEGFLYRVGSAALATDDGWLKACLVNEYADHLRASEESPSGSP